jgi:beta-lactamase regulating signal transducer with metallopeptidase domain
MNLSYLFRLACLSLASFYLIQLTLGLVTRAIAPSAIHLAERLRPRLAARLMFILRLLPAGVAVFAVFALCLPSYLWFEPHSSAENLGIACAVAAILGVAVWTISIFRVLRASAASLRCARQWRRMGQQFRLPDNASEILVIDENSPLLALAGIFHSRLVASRSVLTALSAEQFSAALRHERAHHTSRDNFKRLLLLLAPEVFPFTRAFAALEGGWARFAEWAADDRAVEGDAHRSLSLAEALVRVARLGAAPPLSPFLSSLLPDNHDLSARVDRLLHPATPSKESNVRIRWMLASAAFSFAVFFVAALLQPATFYSVHRLLEHFVR